MLCNTNRIELTNYAIFNQSQAGSSKIPVGQVIAVLAEEGDDISSITAPSDISPPGSSSASSSSAESSSSISTKPSSEGESTSNPDFKQPSGPNAKASGSPKSGQPAERSQGEVQVGDKREEKAAKIAGEKGVDMDVAGHKEGMGRDNKAMFPSVMRLSVVHNPVHELELVQSDMLLIETDWQNLTSRQKRFNR